MTTQNLPAAHSKLGASSMYRWRACPGSVRLSASLPPAPESSYAQEGTKAHDLAAAILQDGKFCREAMLADPEMLEAVTVYTSHVFDLMKQGGEVMVEQRFDLSRVYPGCFGTSDAVVYFEKTKTLHVIDYKHGEGIPVSIMEGGKPNPQLMYYALGAMIHLAKLPVTNVVITIVQPRCYHADGPVRSLEVHPMDVIEFMADLQDYAAATEKPDAAIVPGSHCRFCPAQAVCPKLSENATELAKTVFDSALPYDMAKLTLAMKMLPNIESWASSVREFAYAQAMSGVEIPGWKLVEKVARRKWNGDVTADTLTEALGILPEEAFEEPKVKSPAQIEKLLSKGDKKKLEGLVTAVSSGLTLVEESNTRPAVTPQSAAQLFNTEETEKTK